MGRLYAHFLWLSTIEYQALWTPDASGLDDAGATPADWRGNGFAVAMADGVVSPAEITMLGKIYRLLGLESRPTSPVPCARIDDRERARPPAVRPVVVRPGDTPRTGLSRSRRDRTIQNMGAATPPAARPFALDTAAIERKLAETAEVGALLANLFVDEDTHPVPTTTGSIPLPEREAPESPNIGALDAAHSTMLRIVAKRKTWSRAGVRIARRRVSPDAGRSNRRPQRGSL